MSRFGGGGDGAPRGEVPASVGLHLVLGPPNSGKLGVVLRWWARLRAEAPVVVVPSRADAADVEVELLSRAGVVLGEPPVLTIDRLVSALRPAGAFPIVGGLRRRLLLGDVARSPARADRPLHRLAAHPGGLDAVTALFDGLGEGGLPAGGVRRALRRWAEGPGGDLAEDLAGAWDEYVAGLTAWGRVDRHRALEEAVEASASWGRPVAFHGFMSFTPGQRALVVGLARRVPVVVTLVADAERGLAGEPEEEAAALRPRAVSETILPRQGRVFGSPQLAFLERRFLETGPSVADDAVVGAHDLEGPERPVRPRVSAETGGTAAGAVALAGVRFLLASGRRNEAELVAAEIVGLLRAGVDPDDIGVLVRRMEPWRGVLADVFTRYGVPHRLDGSVAFGATGLGFALLSALRGVARSDPGLLLGFLRGPYHPMSVREVDEVEVAVRRGIGASDPARAWPGSLGGALDPIRAVLRLGAGGVEGLYPDGLVALAADLLTTSALVNAEGSPVFEQDARALAVLARAVGETEEDDAGAAPDGAPGGGLSGRPFESVCAALEGLPVPLGYGDEVGVVRITTVRRARARRFTAVFVLGLVEGEFPGADRQPDLLGAAERSALSRAAGVPVLPPARSPMEPALFASALSRPWQLLYLSARDAEDDGSEALPSPFWTEALRLLPEAAVGPRRGLEDLVFPPTTAPTWREFLRSCAAARMSPADQGQAERLRRARSWDCRPSRLTHPHLTEVLAGREVFSATEIERYAQCPFGWFAERAVGLETMEEDLGPLQAGGLAHRVLRHVYDELSRSGRPRLDAGSLSFALSTAGERLAAEIEGMRDRWPEAGLRLLEADVGQRLRSFLAFDAASGSTLEVGGVEVDLPADGVDLDGFRLTGRIDRVDRDPVSGAAVVVDYKSGSEVYGPAFAERGALQVPLYVLALRRSGSGTDVAGGIYIGLRGLVRRGAVRSDAAALAGDWVPSGSRVDEEALGRELDRVLASAREAVAGIRAGDIRAEPLGACPTYCALSPMCRTPRKAATW